MTTAEKIQELGVYSSMAKIRRSQIEGVNKFLDMLSYDFTHISAETIIDIFGKRFYIDIINALDYANIIDINHSYIANGFSGKDNKSKSYKLCTPTTNEDIDSMINTWATGAINAVSHASKRIKTTEEYQKTIVDFTITSNNCIEIVSNTATLTSIVYELKSGNVYNSQGDIISFVDGLTALNRVYTKKFHMVNGNSNCERIWTTWTGLSGKLRTMVLKINGEEMVPCDFKSMHPNIVMKMAGYNHTVTHDEVSSYLGIARSIAKTEHLSFFNKRISDMKKSPLWKFYNEKYPNVIKFNQTVKSDSHKDMSALLFREETKIMGEIAEQLLKSEIAGVYVYDCMYVQKSKAEEVSTMMNDIAASIGYDNLIVPIEPPKTIIEAPIRDELDDLLSDIIETPNSANYKAVCQTTDGLDELLFDLVEK